MAMVTTFPGNGGGLYVEYHKKYKHFVCLYKNSTRFFNDPVELRRVLGCAKFTATGQALKDWAVEMLSAGSSPEVQPRKDTSFASEAMEEAENDPTKNTRMIV
jgi:hypothetical protein